MWFKQYGKCGILIETSTQSSIKVYAIMWKNETGELKGFIKIHKPLAFYLQQKHGSPVFEIY